MRRKSRGDQGVNRTGYRPQGTIVDPQYFNTQGNPIITVGVPSAPVADFQAALDGNDFYAYQVSLLNGDDQISIAPGGQNTVEVGTGGTATIAGGSNTTLWIWHEKNVVWTTTGTHNVLVFDARQGSNIQTSGVLFLNLATGVGINPWGGTLSFQGVDQVAVGSIGGEYIVGNNDGDTINSGDATFGFAGNALIVGGTGNDTLNGSSVGVFGGSVRARSLWLYGRRGCSRVFSAAAYQNIGACISARSRCHNNLIDNRSGPKIAGVRNCYVLNS